MTFPALKYPKSLNNFLFYQEDKPVETLTSEGDSIDFDALSEGQENFYIGKRAMPIKEKRTLIITDEFFSLPNRNKFPAFPDKYSPLILLLQFLLKEEFTLYGHTHAGLKKIENEWQLSSILPLVVAASEQTVLEMALISRGLYQDKVKVLNAATLRYLLIMLKNHLKISNDEKANLSKGIPIDFFAELPPINRSRLYASLQGSPKLELEIDTIDKERLPIIEEVFKALGDSIETINFNIPDKKESFLFVKLLNIYAPSFLKLSRLKAAFFQEEADDLMVICSSLPALTSLNLQFKLKNSYQFLSNLSKRPLPKLHALCVDHIQYIKNDTSESKTSAPPHDLFTLIQLAFPNIKRLSIDYLEAPIHLKELSSMELLQSLKVVHNNHPLPFHRFPNLRHLNASLYSFPLVKLTQLITLTVRESNCFSESGSLLKANTLLQQISDNCPNLKKLICNPENRTQEQDHDHRIKINYGKWLEGHNKAIKHWVSIVENSQFNETAWKSIKNLNQLKKLIIHDEEISYETLTTLLLRCPSIDTLVFHGREISYSKNSVMEKHISPLKHFLAEYAEFGGPNLANFLQKTPFLLTLKVKNIYEGIVNDEVKNIPDHIPIKVLCITGEDHCYNNPFTFMQKFFSTLTHLTMGKFYLEQFDRKKSSESLPCFPLVTHLTLGSTITFKLLSLLSKIFPSLQEINFCYNYDLGNDDSRVSNNDTLGGTFDFKVEHVFPRLQKLNFSSVIIGDEVIHYFIAHAPNLQAISLLNESYFIEGEAFLESPLLTSPGAIEEQRNTPGWRLLNLNFKHYTDEWVDGEYKDKDEDKDEDEDEDEGEGEDEYDVSKTSINLMNFCMQRSIPSSPQVIDNITYKDIGGSNWPRITKILSSITKNATLSKLTLIGDPGLDGQRGLKLAELLGTKSVGSLEPEFLVIDNFIDIENIKFPTKTKIIHLINIEISPEELTLFLKNNTHLTELFCSSRSRFSLEEKRALMNHSSSTRVSIITSSSSQKRNDISEEIESELDEDEDVPTANHSESSTYTHKPRTPGTVSSAPFYYPLIPLFADTVFTQKQKEEVIAFNSITRLSIQDALQVTPTEITFNSAKTDIQVIDHMKRTTDPLIRDYTRTKAYLSMYRFGKGHFFLESKSEESEHWTPIKSITFHDELYSEYEADKPLQWGHCTLTGQYFVRLEEGQPPCEVTLSIIMQPDPFYHELELNKEIPSTRFEEFNVRPILFSADYLTSGTLTLELLHDTLVAFHTSNEGYKSQLDHRHLGIAELLTLCHFKQDNVKLNSLTGLAYFNECLRRKEATCEDRTILVLLLFKALKIPNPYRKIANESHVYFEVEFYAWMKINLGGAFLEGDKIEAKPLPALDHSIRVLTPPPIETAPKELKDELLKQEYTSLFTDLTQRAILPTPEALQQTKHLYRHPKTLVFSNNSSALTPMQYIEELMSPHNLGRESASPLKYNVLLSLGADCVPHSVRFETALKKHQGEKKKKFFNLRTFDLIKQYDFVVTDKSTLEKRPSALAQFLKEASAGDILLMNWTHCTIADLAHNTFGDKPRNFLGIPIPAGVVIISLKRADQTFGADMHSRFGFIGEAPSLSSISLKPEEAKLENPPQKSYLPIVLLPHSSWRKELLGHVRVQGSEYIHEEGPLLKLAYPEKITSSTLPTLGLSYQAIELYGTEHHPELLSIQQAETFDYRGARYSFKKECLRFNSHPYPFYPVMDKSTAGEGEGKEEKVEKKNDPLPTLPTPVYLSERNKRTYDYILNSTTFNLFFSTYFFKDKHVYSGSSKEGTGWIRHASAGKPMVILVTEALSLTEWAYLMNKAHRIGRTLEFIFRPDIKPPRGLYASSTVLSEEMSPLEEKEKKQEAASSIVHIIETIDVDFTAHQLFTSTNKERYTVIDVDSTDKYSTLFDPKYTAKEHDAIQFHAKRGEAYYALEQGKDLILKGSFSKEMRHSLESVLMANPYLWINGARMPIPKGRKIYLITSDKKLIPHCEIRSTHIVHPSELQAELEKQVPKKVIPKEEKPSEGMNLKGDGVQEMNTSEDKEEKRSTPILSPKNEAGYAILRSQLFIKNNTNKINVDKNKVYVLEAQTDSLKKRTLALAHMIEHSLGTLILGETGAGKSYTVMHELPLLYGTGIKLFLDMNNSAAWAKSAEEGQIKLLFIDEANLDITSLNSLKGLFNDPPALFTKEGERIPLKPHHRILFAGNPLSYERRSAPPIFDYCAPITFDPISDSALCSSVIQKALKNTFSSLLTSEFSAIETVLFKAFNTAKTILNQSTHLSAHVLTPRDLEAMILRIALLHQHQLNIFQAKMPQLIWFAMYEHMRYLLSPTDKSMLKNTMRLEFKEDRSDYKTRKSMLNRSYLETKNETKAPIDTKQSPYTLTRKRVAAARLLSYELEARQFKMRKNISALGKCGVLFEGAAATGKSELALYALHRLGYHKLRESEVKEMKEENGESKYFLHLSAANMNRFERLLLRAFHKGLIVVIDEIDLNTAAEKLLNHLLSGVDVQGNKAEQPGFFIIGSKNPLSYEGRRPLSKALTNRFCIITLEEYIEEELICIGEVNEMANATLCAKGFFFEKEQARINRKEALTLRDFLSNEKLWTQIGQRLLDETSSSSSEEELTVTEEKHSGEKRKREPQAIQEKESNNKKTKNIFSSFLSTSERIPSSVSTSLSSTPALIPLSPLIALKLRI